MTTTAQLLARYNAAAIVVGKPTLRAYKASKQALIVRVDQLEAEVAALAIPSTSAASVIAEFAINPKVGRALLRKHNVERTPAAIRAFFKSRAA